MTLWSHRRRRPIAGQCFTLLLWLLSVEILFAQNSGDDSAGSAVQAATNFEQRINQLEQRQSELVEQNRLLLRRLQDLSAQNQQPSTGVNDPNGLPPAPSTGYSTTGNGNGGNSENNVRSPSEIFPAHAFDTSLEFPLERKSSMLNSEPTKYFVGYDRGFVIRPTDADESPFELKINGQDQIRYAGFQRKYPTWTDSAGDVNTVSD
jgi:hypothetical protein